MQGEEEANPTLGSQEGLQHASAFLPCYYPNGRDSGWMDRRLGLPGSENRKPNLFKIIQGEGRK